MAHAYSYQNSASKAAEILGHLRSGHEVDLGRSKEFFSSVSSASPISERELLWKQDVRIVPLTAVIAFLGALNRGNIGNARGLNATVGRDLMSDTGMTAYRYNVVLTVFLVACALFAAPSNILLKQLRPSRWLAAIMFGWGAVSMCLGVATNSSTVAGVRFLLGVFQAGLFPGLVYYLTFWYTAEERSVRFAFILTSAAIASAFGGAIAYAVGQLYQVNGASPWRYMLIIEGAPSCLVALFVLFLLPDYPEKCSWLSDGEKEFAMRRLFIEGSKGYDRAWSWGECKVVLLGWPLYGHYLLFLGVSAPLISLALFTPSIVAGLGRPEQQAQLMIVPPYIVACVIQLLVAWSADRFGSRAVHSAAMAVVGVCGFLGLAHAPSDAFGAQYGCLFVAAAGTLACIPPLLGWLTANVGGTVAVGLAVALNTGVGGSIGQIVGVWSYKDDEATKGYPTGHWVNAVLLFLVAIGCVLLRFHYRARNNWIRMETGGGDEIRFFKY